MESKVSDRELDRRWNLVRKVMGQEGIDFLICGGGQPGGYARWLSNRSPPGSLIAFPIEGDLLFVTHGDSVHARPVDSYGIKGLVTSAQPNLSINTHAPALIDAMKQKRPNTIGFLGMGFLTASTYEALLKAFPSAKLIDASDLVVPIKAVKSEEELSFIKRGVELHDMAIEIMKHAIKPGRTMDDVIFDVKQAVLLAGSEFQLISGGSAPPGTPCKYVGPSSRRLKDGDQVAMLIECSAYGGYFGELWPTACIGGVPKELQKVFDDAVEAQSLLVSLAKPGADPMEMLKASNKFLTERGYPPEGRLAGHSQGYDLVERPALSPLGETVKLQAGMMMSLHPTCHTEKAWGFPPSQNFLVTDSGAKKMQETPEEIIVV